MHPLLGVTCTISTRQESDGTWIAKIQHWNATGRGSSEDEAKTRAWERVSEIEKEYEAGNKNDESLAQKLDPLPW